MPTLDLNDKLQTVIARPYADKTVHAKAYAVLRQRHAQGKLPPVLDGTGDTIADYVDILGIMI